MASEAILGYGTVFGFGESFTALAQPKDIPMPEAEAADVDITNQDSPDAFKEYIAGLLEGNTIEIELVYKASEHERLTALQRTKDDAKITYPDGSEHTFKAYLKKVGGSAPVEDAMTSTVSFKVCSIPAFSAGSSA